MSGGLPAIIESDGYGYVAIWPEAYSASRWDTVTEARDNPNEALALFFETASDSEIERRLHSEGYVIQVKAAVGSASRSLGIECLPSP